MRLTSLAPTVPAQPAPSPVLDDAVLRLDWAHETAGTAVSDAEYVEFETLVSASQDAATAAELLDSIQQPLAAEHARTAANAFDSAAMARRNEDPDVAAGVIAARGEDAEAAIHEAFTALGMDGRGE